MDRVHCEFWIDVGGTFTDCFARFPGGRLLRHKLLSSAVTKSTVQAGSGRERIVDTARGSDPPEFWNGYTLTLFDSAGKRLGSSRIARFDRDSAVLQLSAPLPIAPAAGQPYELASGEEAPILAIRYLLGCRLDAKIPRVRVRLGTTRGTNALLTRSGAITALVTTRGFGDVLQIAYQGRPDLFALAIEKPQPLAAVCVEIDERLAADGSVLRPIDLQQARERFEWLKSQNIESLAICLLHAYRNAEHEEQLVALAREIGFEEISVSHRLSRLIKLVSRGDTTVVDAYLNPVLRQYVDRLRSALGQSDLRILTSAGGLVQAEHFVGKDSILSGPAGGVVGFSRVAAGAGSDKAIGFDMGGTSTDVSRFDGSYRLDHETKKAGVRIVAPMMAIETVAAGGGSICGFDGVKLFVGPASAGADPGPACYGRGGPLAITDINLFLGKIPPDRFPFPLDRDAVEQRLQTLADEIAESTGKRYHLVELADGFLQIANVHMAGAIRSVSIAEGADVREYVLVAFGGAAAQHACAVAEQLGIRQVLNHPDAGILSAYGIGLADVVRHRAQGIYTIYSPELLAELEPRFQTLTEEASREIAREGVAPDRIEVARALDLRYAGLDAYLTIAEPADGDYRSAYEREHERLYGYIQAERPLELVALRVTATGRVAAAQPRSGRAAAQRVRVSERSVDAYFGGRRQQTAIFDRQEFDAGDIVHGPAVICESVSTTVIDPGWQGEVLTGGELLLTFAGKARTVQVDTESDPIMLEVFNNQFAAIAEQMGIALRNTASSVNVKERLDFSCALFTAEGNLVVNAPHIPVHLGAMSETVRQVIADNPRLEPGDVLVTNDPYRGGSHLPDITVVSPVFDPAGGRLMFFTASRAHHAEIGGIRPGSMPPFSKNLAEEGVLIQNFYLFAAGAPRWEALEELLSGGPYPSRNVRDNLADIAAQVAANRQGSRDLLRLVEQYTWPVVDAYMRHIQQAASEKMRRALAALPDGRREFVDHLDDGSPIAVVITIAGEQATIDFTGTGPVLPGNLNANRAIVSAAVLYVLRLLIDEDIPLNQGVFEPVEIVLPGCLLNPPPGATPSESPAVVGGNVETSQRVVDVLLGAFRLAAASQGTMNNLLFGDRSFGYYETVGGGSGATALHPGADAVHTHMTNTRLTDPEVLEARYPVRLEEFAIRRSSGGAGRHRGGDGIVRQIRFLSELEVSLLTSRRGAYAPYGLAGGSPGQTGLNQLVRAKGNIEVLGGQVQFTAAEGDVLRIETPGGGGYGPAEDSAGGEDGTRASTV